MASNRSRKWPSAAEVKHDPANWEPIHESGSVASADIRSDVADVDGARKVDTKDALFVKQHELVDWTGGFAPPPVEWDARLPFEDNQMSATIMEWQENVKDVVTESSAGLFQTPKNELLDLGEGPKSEICPTKWVPEQIEGQDPPTWWAAHLQNIIHADSSDFDEVDDFIAPFWDRWLDSYKERLLPVQVPESFVDPDDEMSRKRYRQTSLESAERFSRYQKDRASRLRSAKQEWRQARLDQKNHGHRRTADSTSATNMYLRPAETRDLSQVLDIYNYRVTETLDVPENQPITLEVMGERWADIIDVRLPFVVAVDRSSKGNRRQGRGSGDPGHEHIIGFAFADDYNSPDGMYRYTVEAECYVRNEFLRKRVGTALMDRLLCALDPHYVGTGDYDFIGDQVAYASGGRRVVENIAANITLPTDNRAKLAWCEPWLEKMGFERRGDFPSAGRKLNKIVDLVTYWKKTGSDVPNYAP